MRKFKLPMQSVSLVGVINEMRNQAATKLSAFCTKQILDKRLSTKTFKYDFDISGRRSGGQKKSVQKLREILYKHVKKHIPYVEYIKSGEDFFSVQANHSNRVMFNLESPYLRVTLTNLSIVDSMMNHRWLRSLHRYARFLNHKSIRNGIPLSVEVLNPQREVHPDDLKTVEALSYRTGPTTVRVKLKAKLSVNLCAWEHPDYLQWAQEDCTYDEYEAYLETDDTLKAALKSYRDGSSWIKRDLVRRVLPYPGGEKYQTAEKIFLVLDEMIKVITTLTRRVEYDAAAFNIGSAEAS